MPELLAAVAAAAAAAAAAFGACTALSWTPDVKGLGSLLQITYVLSSNSQLFKLKF
jgi:hypothetical protein